MKLTDILLGVLLGVLLGLGSMSMVSCVSSAYKSLKRPTCVPSDIKMPPIVRLHNKNGQFFCTGVIINTQQAITAAHCVEEMDLNKSNINVRGADSADTCVTASIEAYESRSDIALLSGDFKSFDYLAIATAPQEDLSLLLDPSSLVISCGYPWGGALFCSPLVNRYFYQFDIASLGVLFPGMSGGPVIDVVTGKVIALNYAVIGPTILVSPLINIFDNLGIPQYEGP